MRKKIFIILLVLSGWLAGYGQDVTSKLDQVAPRNKNAGRSVEMKKVMTITDEQGGFFFRWPNDLKTSADGSIFTKDFDQLLYFDNKGKLLHNFHKRGQGPGEFEVNYYYLLSGDRLLIFSAMPNKIIWFNTNGQLEKEIKPTDFTYGDLLMYKNDKYYLIKSDSTMEEAKNQPQIIGGKGVRQNEFH